MSIPAETPAAVMIDARIDETVIGPWLDVAAER